MPKSYPSVKFILIAVCAFHLSPLEAKTFGGKVVGIADGDTLTVVTRSKRQHKIRLAGIDAPEKQQPFGERSKQSLSDLCFGKQAAVTTRVVDRYKRVVANVKCDGVDVNAEQVNGEWPGHTADTSTGTIISIFWNSVRGWRNADSGLIPILLHPGNGEITENGVCGCFEYQGCWVPIIPSGS